MTLEAILSILIPVIIYVVLEKRKGLKIAVLSSLVMATLLVFYFVIRYDFNDRLLWLEYGLLMGLGATTIKLNNDHFFKFQPVIVNGVLGVYILAVHFLDGPIMLRYMSLFEKMIEDPQLLNMIKTPRMQEVMSSLSWMLGVIMIAHALLVSYAALKWSTVKWMWARLSIYPAMMVVSLIAGITA
jgi:intracellular septation protein A